MIINASQRSRQSGFSLIELALVLAIAAVIILIGINRYQQYRFNADIEVVKQNINLLFNALNTYYRQNCNKDTPFNVDMASLKSKNLLPNLPKVNLLSTLANGYQFEVSAKYIKDVKTTNSEIKRPVYMLNIIAIPQTIGDTATQALYQQLLGGTQSSFGIITWSRLPTYTVPTVSSQLWMMRSGSDYFKNYVTQRNINSQTDTSCAFE